MKTCRECGHGFEPSHTTCAECIAKPAPGAEAAPWRWAVEDPDTGIDLYTDGAKARDRAGDGVRAFPVYLDPPGADAAIEARILVDDLAAAAQSVMERMERMLRGDFCDCEGGHICGRPAAEREVKALSAALAALRAEAGA